MAIFTIYSYLLTSCGGHSSRFVPIQISSDNFGSHVPGSSWILFSGNKASARNGGLSNSVRKKPTDFLPVQLNLISKETNCERGKIEPIVSCLYHYDTNCSMDSRRKDPSKWKGWNILEKFLIYEVIRSILVASTIHSWRAACSTSRRAKFCDLVPYFSCPTMDFHGTCFWTRDVSTG